MTLSPRKNINRRVCCPSTWEGYGLLIGRQRVRPSTYGFTLLELLVSVVIVGVLLLVAFGTMGRISEKSKSARCSQQMRQLTNGMLSWCAENNGLLFPTVRPDGVPWTMPIAQYMNLKDRLRCPHYFELYGDSWVFATGYGMSRYLASSNAVTGSAANYNNRAKISQISQPARTVLLYEMNNQAASEASGGYPRDGEKKWAYTFYAPHEGGFYVTFFDGHIEWVRFNKDGPFDGEGAGDYPDFVWKPY